MHAGYLGLQIHTRSITCIAFLMHQCLHEHASILRYMYIACFYGIKDIHTFRKLCYFVNIKFSFLSYGKVQHVHDSRKNSCCDVGLRVSDSHRLVFGCSSHCTTSGNPFAYVSSRRKHCVSLARVFIFFYIACTFRYVD
jgi:hypothetical protein